MKFRGGGTCTACTTGFRSKHLSQALGYTTIACIAGENIGWCARTCLEHSGGRGPAAVITDEHPS